MLLSTLIRAEQDVPSALAQYRVAAAYRVKIEIPHVIWARICPAPDRHSGISLDSVYLVVLPPGTLANYTRTSGNRDVGV
jgi:hypothetical protein